MAYFGLNFSYIRSRVYTKKIRLLVYVIISKNKWVQCFLGYKEDAIYVCKESVVQENRSSPINTLLHHNYSEYTLTISFCKKVMKVSGTFYNDMTPPPTPPHTRNIFYTLICLELEKSEIYLTKKWS